MLTKETLNKQYGRKTSQVMSSPALKTVKTPLSKQKANEGFSKITRNGKPVLQKMNNKVKDVYKTPIEKGIKRGTINQKSVPKSYNGIKSALDKIMKNK